MRRLALVLVILPALAACASAPTRQAAQSKKAVDAVVQDESKRQKVVAAVNAGATPDQALAKVADGPKPEISGPPK
jgi:hypothetical protein